MVRKLWQPEHEEADYVVTTVEKPRAMNAGAHPAFFFYFRPGPQDRCHPRSGWGFLTEFCSRGCSKPHQLDN